MQDETPEGLLAELDLQLPQSLAPRTPREVMVEYERDLTQADIALLASGARGATDIKALVRIRSSHHSVARCLAAGMKPAQVALVTGYAAPRISFLQNDSAFQALVEDYKAEAKSVFADLAERMNDMSLDAIEMLHERLHDKPEEFSIPMLLDVVKTFADRTGHGPNQDVNLKISAELIDRPPKETYEDWQARRATELSLPSEVIKKLN